MFIPAPPLGMSQFGAPLGMPAGAPQPVEPPPPPPSPEEDFDRSLNYLADYSGCGFWRMIWPEHLLNAHQKAVIHSTTMMVLDERYYQNTKTVRLQRQATENQLQFVRLLKQFREKMPFNIIYEIDDIVFGEDIPDYNKFKPAFTDPKIRESAMSIMQEVDEITCTNKFMQEYYRDKTGNKNVTVIPNYPPKWWMGHFYDKAAIERNFHKNKKKPRIVYSASGAHFDVDNRVGQKDDFHHVVDVIRRTVDDYQWVFLGAHPLPLTDLVTCGKIEFYNWSRLYEYPQLLKDARPNLFIAPLIDNTFNRAKSDLKYIEACCHGIPAICQDLCTYENAPFKFNTGDELIDQIKRLVGHKSPYMKHSDNARAIADTRWLELDENIDKYQQLYKYPYKHPERTLLNSLADNQ
jgi:hypothetical protein